jgi:hypothetical protein
MKIPLDVQKTEVRSQEPRQLFYFRFAAALALLCLGAALLLPAIKNAVGNNHPTPKGQLQADARTLLATVHYLFEAESDFEKNPSLFNGSSPSFVQRINGRSFEKPNVFYNQTTHFNYSSNPPAQT